MSGTARRRTSWLRQARLVLEKDIRAELATGEVLITAGFVAVLLVVVASFAFRAGPEAGVRVAPGVIWVAVAFASVLALSRAWQRERENDALAGLLVMPIARSAIFAGKALGLVLFLAAIELLVVPTAALLFDLPLGRLGPGLFLLCAAATPGIAASGTLFGAMTVRTRARDLVLAGVLFPLLAPALLAAVAGTRELCSGATVGELADYLELMVLFALLFVAGGVGLFGLLVDE
ncbi:MAG: heme exporter protein CcmB [Deltaproteobacteria bacterium]|nr:heme exporter protein CcmB [Deltaproteobacteria bacterium]